VDPDRVRAQHLNLLKERLHDTGPWPGPAAAGGAGGPCSRRRSGSRRPQRRPPAVPWENPARRREEHPVGAPQLEGPAVRRRGCGSSAPRSRLRTRIQRAGPGQRRPQRPVVARGVGPAGAQRREHLLLATELLGEPSRPAPRRSSPAAKARARPQPARQANRRDARCVPAA
jgi:hypothetical protein